MPLASMDLAFFFFFYLYASARVEFDNLARSSSSSSSTSCKCLASEMNEFNEKSNSNGPIPFGSRVKFIIALTL